MVKFLDAMLTIVGQWTKRIIFDRFHTVIVDVESENWCSDFSTFPWSSYITIHEDFAYVVPHLTFISTDIQWRLPSLYVLGFHVKTNKLGLSLDGNALPRNVESIETRASTMGHLLKITTLDMTFIQITHDFAEWTTWCVYFDSAGKGALLVF